MTWDPIGSTRMNVPGGSASYRSLMNGSKLISIVIRDDSLRVDLIVGLLFRQIGLLS